MAEESKHGNWVDGAAMEGDRWVDPMDEAAVDAWGSAPAPLPAPEFEPHKAFQEKPQRRTSLQGGSEMRQPMPGSSSFMLVRDQLSVVNPCGWHSEYH
jgi:hypothetical protein